jgi:hypothetical protein
MKTIFRILIFPLWAIGIGFWPAGAKQTRQHAHGGKKPGLQATQRPPVQRKAAARQQFSLAFRKPLPRVRREPSAPPDSDPAARAGP